MLCTSLDLWRKQGCSLEKVLLYRHSADLREFCRLERQLERQSDAMVHLPTTVYVNADVSFEDQVQHSTTPPSHSDVNDQAGSAETERGTGVSSVEAAEAAVCCLA